MTNDRQGEDPRRRGNPQQNPGQNQRGGGTPRQNPRQGGSPQQNQQQGGPQQTQRQGGTARQGPQQTPPQQQGGAPPGGGDQQPATGGPDPQKPEWLSLDADEEIEWIGSPATNSLIGTAITGIVLSFVLVGLLILLSLPFSYLSIRNTDYVVTTKSLYVKSGVFSTNIESVSLDKIQNTEYSQSFWGKKLGFGTIAISTAGSGGSDLSFSNIPEASEVRERINRLSSEYGGGVDGGAGSAGESAERASQEQLDALVEELRATRRALEGVEERLRESGVAEPAGDRSARESTAGDDASGDANAASEASMGGDDDPFTDWVEGDESDADAGGSPGEEHGDAGESPPTDTGESHPNDSGGERPGDDTR